MNLENTTSEKYGTDYHNHLLEQWKTCVQMANSISERRLKTNSVYITINSAIFAFNSFNNIQNIILPIIGITVCILWFFSVESYRKLNEVKYDIINKLEKHLPATPFAYEWNLIKDNNKYKSFTKLEMILPWVFIIIYLIIVV